ncbi:CBS domain-containing protein [Actinoplanes sp. NPDC049118]|uniref:CBS domain-containing protein n=1 Tax=Actinoplanes sp. NPDC049118 TaxID=3155769 RepID=UPI0033D20547
MSSPAVCGYAGQTVSDFLARVAATHPHRCYPVVDIDGRLFGLITMPTLARVAAKERAAVRLAELSIPVAELRVAQRNTPATDPAALPADPLRFTVVLDGSRPCGVLTTGDLSHGLAVARRGETPDRSAGPLDDALLEG